MAGQEVRFREHTGLEACLRAKSVRIVISGCPVAYNLLSVSVVYLKFLVSLSLCQSHCLSLFLPAGAGNNRPSRPSCVEAIANSTPSIMAEQSCVSASRSLVCWVPYTWSTLVVRRSCHETKIGQNKSPESKREEE